MVELATRMRGKQFGQLAENRPPGGGTENMFLSICLTSSTDPPDIVDSSVFNPTPVQS